MALQCNYILSPYDPRCKGVTPAPKPVPIHHKHVDIVIPAPYPTNLRPITPVAPPVTTVVSTPVHVPFYQNIWFYEGIGLGFLLFFIFWTLFLRQKPAKNS